MTDEAIRVVRAADTADAVTMSRCRSRIPAASGSFLSKSPVDHPLRRDAR